MINFLNLITVIIIEITLMMAGIFFAPIAAESK